MTLGSEQQDVGPPQEGQAIVRALGSRGSNLVEVEYPDGRTTLVLMPARFNKKLWVKRGGYLVIEDSPQAEADTKVTGSIVAVLYDEHIKALAKLPGVWPSLFASSGDKAALQDVLPPPCSDGEGDGQEAPQGQATACHAHDAENDDEEEEDSRPPLQPNTNRKVIYHEVSDEEDSDDEGPG